MRFARGITLSPAERLHAGLVPRGPNGSAAQTHLCQVTMPDGTACQVSYTRLNARSHKFAFLQPVLQHLWIDPLLDGSITAIETKAQELTVEAFRLAQLAEQKEMKTGSRSPRADNQAAACPFMKAKTAREYAGQYAVCIEFGESHLMRIGRPTNHPEDLAAEIEQPGYRELLIPGQRLVIGICNRSARRWVIPRFLAERFPEPAELPPSKITTPTRRPVRGKRRLKPAAPPTDTAHPQEGASDVQPVTNGSSAGPAV